MSSQATVKPGGYAWLPQLYDSVLRSATRLGALRLDAARIEASARRAAGASDFGGDDWREPLEILLRDLHERPPSALGQAMIFATLEKALVNRLKVQAAVNRNDCAPVRKPLVVVGWYRSGTTFLHNLLDAIPGYGYIPVYRLMEPIPRFGERLRMLITLRLAWTVAPEMPAVHPQRVTGPEEDWILM